MTDKKNPKWVPQLLAWYDVHKRELPWRGCGDPYKIWVSEVMSQQTRIEAMKPYYDNWMRLFPTLEDLAKASEDEVVHAWQGLGYYSRARNLRLGVKDVVENYGGIVPHDRKTMEGRRFLYGRGCAIHGVQRTRGGCRWQCTAHLCSVVSHL